MLRTKIQERRAQIRELEKDIDALQRSIDMLEDRPRRRKAQRRAKTGRKARGTWSEIAIKYFEDGKPHETADIARRAKADGLEVNYKALALWLQRSAERGALARVGRGLYQRPVGEPQ